MTASPPHRRGLDLSACLLVLVAMACLISVLKESTILKTVSDTNRPSVKKQIAANASVAEKMGSEQSPLWRSVERTGPSDENSSKHKQPPFRMLLGIFSMESKSEYARRKLIYNTYLSCPKFLARYNVTTIPIGRSRICSLNHLLIGNISQPEDCQLLYTFVVGAANQQTDPTAVKEYLHVTPDRPMTVDPSQIRNYREDTTYLNIVENMNDGKSLTWFKYASSLQLPDDYQIDLIAKVDSDCVVYPPRLVSQIDQLVPHHNLSYPLWNRAVYGGSRQMGSDKSYMQGGFYFLSHDLATYITSDKCNRTEIIDEYKKIPRYKNKRAEDVEVSRLVQSYNQQQQHEPKKTIHQLVIARKVAYEHNFKVKETNQFRSSWKWYIASEVAYDRMVKIQATFGSKCPPTEALEEQAQLFGAQEMPRMKQRFELMTKHLLGNCKNKTSSNHSNTDSMALVAAASDE